MAPQSSPSRINTGTSSMIYVAGCRRRSSIVSAISSNSETTKRCILVLGFLTTIVVALVMRDFLTSRLKNIQHWIDANPVEGVFVCAAVYTLATITFIPGIILSVGVGFVFSSVFGIAFGIAIGTAAIFVGASSGAFIAFILGRFVFRSCIQLHLKRPAKLTAIDRVLEQEGLRIVSLLRLSKLLPFAFGNYVYGATSIRFRNFAMASFGFLPGIITKVSIGSVLRTINDAYEGKKVNPESQVILIVVTIGAIVLTIWLSMIAERVLGQVLNADNVHQNTLLTNVATVCDQVQGGGLSKDGRRLMKCSSPPSDQAGNAIMIRSIHTPHELSKQFWHRNSLSDARGLQNIYEMQNIQEFDAIRLQMNTNEIDDGPNPREEEESSTRFTQEGR